MGTKEVPSNPTGLKTVLVCVTNAIYETMLMFLLGYGLVELPKSLWSMCNLERQLVLRQTKAATDYKAFQEAQIDVQKIVASCLKTKEKLGTGGEPQVAEALSIMLAECPQEFKSARSGEVAQDKAGKVTIDTLAALRTKLNVTKATYRMAQARLENTQMGAYMYEDLVEARARNNRRSDKYDGERVVRWQLKGTSGSRQEYTWLVERRPMLCRIAGVCLGALSLLCIIGGISSMHGVPKQTSLYFAIVHMPTASRGGIAFFILLTFGYLIVVTLWSLLQLKSLGFELVRGRTTPYSLSACFRMIASLAFPLTFFYLGWMGENGTESDGPWMFFSEPRNTTFATTLRVTVPAGIYYTNATHWVPRLHRNVTVQIPHNATAVVMRPALTWRLVPDYMPCAFAQMYLLPPSTNYAFGTVYPVVLIIFLLLFVTQAYNRLCVCLKCPTYQFGDPVVTKEQLDEGLKSLNKWRKIAQRTVQRHEIARIRAERDADRSIRLLGCVLWRRETLREQDERHNKEEREAQRKMRSEQGEGRKEAKKEELNVDHLDKPEDLSGFAQCRVQAEADKGGSVKADKGGSVKETKEAKKDKFRWVDCYVELRPPNMLYVLTDQAMAEEDPPVLSPSLPAPVEVGPCTAFAKIKADKDGKHGLKVSLLSSAPPPAAAPETTPGDDLPPTQPAAATELFRIRFPVAEDAENWRRGLEEWREYARTHAREVENLKAQRERDRVEAEHKEREAKFKHEAELEAALHAEERKSHSISRRMSHSLRASMSSKSSRESFTTNPMRLAGHAAARYDLSQSSAQPTTDVNLEVRPDTVEGWLELKSFTKVWFGSKYRKYYFRIHEGTSSLQYFHSEDVEDVQPVGYLDLRVAAEAKASTKYGDSRDAFRFSCAVDSLVYVFKAPEASEARLWVRLMNLWREYLLLKLSHKLGPQSEKRLSAERERKAQEDKENREKRASAERERAAAADVTDEGTAATAELTEASSPTVSAESAASTGSAGSSDELLSSKASKMEPPPAKLKVAPRASQALSPALLRAAGIAGAVQGTGALSKGTSRRKSVTKEGGDEEEKGPGGMTIAR